MKYLFFNFSGKKTDLRIIQTIKTEPFEQSKNKFNQY